MEKEEDTANRLEEAREARVFPLFRLSMDFFASPSVYTPGAFLPSISAVFFPIFFFLSPLPALLFTITSFVSRFEATFVFHFLFVDRQSVISGD